MSTAQTRNRKGPPARRAGLSALCLALLVACSPAQQGAQGEAELTADEARAIAKEAYTFHYPLVMYYRTMYLQAIDPDSDSSSGGFSGSRIA